MVNLIGKVRSKARSKLGFTKEQISETVTMLIVVVVIMAIIVPIFTKQKVITKSIRDKEIEIQEKFKIID